MSYGCQCGGKVNGRVNPELTDPYIKAVENWTGDRPHSCPWSVFYRPIVKDVLYLYPFFLTNQLALVIGTDPPPRLLDALAHYHVKLETIKAKQMEAKIKASRSHD